MQCYPIWAWTRVRILCSSKLDGKERQVTLQGGLLLWTTLLVFDTRGSICFWEPKPLDVLLMVAPLFTSVVLPPCADGGAWWWYLLSQLVPSILSSVSLPQCYILHPSKLVESMVHWFYPPVCLNLGKIQVKLSSILFLGFFVHILLSLHQ